MGANTRIEWCHHTFNPWWGCSKVSPGCDNCYAEAWARRQHVAWGPAAERRINQTPAYWRQPLAWNAAAERDGQRRRVFCSSMGDLFESRSELVPARQRVFELIDQTPWLDWILLTKRPQNMPRLAPQVWRPTWPPNVWALATAETQHRLEQVAGHLSRVPARVRGISVEPMIVPIDLRRWQQPPHTPLPTTHPWIKWVIVGGETGPGARRMDPAWVRNVRDQCVTMGVPFFFKSWGGDRRHDRVLDDRVWDELPAAVEAAST